MFKTCAFVSFQTRHYLYSVKQYVYGIVRQNLTNLHIVDLNTLLLKLILLVFHKCVFV